jgi:hypothetical protein
MKIFQLDNQSWEHSPKLLLLRVGVDLVLFKDMESELEGILIERVKMLKYYD